MISKFAEVLTDNIGENVTIESFTYIGKNVVIGNDVVIHQNVTIAEGVEIADGVEIFPGAYIGKPAKGPALGSHPEFEKKLKVGAHTIVGPNAILYYGDEIGELTLISDGVSIRENCIIGNKCIIGRNVTINYATKIGNRVKVMDLAHITAHTVIEDEAFIGPHVCTADDNKFGKDANENPDEIGGSLIKRNASIGEGAMLLPCVIIGENSVVGSGSVVTKDVEDGATVMGIPARKR